MAKAAPPPGTVRLGGLSPLRRGERGEQCMHGRQAMCWRLLCIVSIAAFAIPRAEAQDSVAEFYRGKQITVIVGSSAGGGYDIYARLLSRHMPKHIPGNPTLTVTNMPGAGSNAAAAHLFNVAPKDGTTIGALQNSAVMDALFDALLGNARQLRH